MSESILKAVKDEAEGVRTHVTAEAAKLNDTISKRKPVEIVAGFVAVFLLFVAGHYVAHWIG